MDNYCLNRMELSKFLSVEFGSASLELEDTNIQLLIEQWENWQLEFVCLATLLSQILESKQKQEEDVYIILQEIYTLSDRKGLFLVEEIGAEFIEYMFRYIRNEELNIEDHLVEIRRDMGDYRY
ncbi:MAG TPA: hypothetical protein DDZ80_10350 [Cyanobacteria bacterium UBA8803]|nr:hypothetical protein [Cyanobacteria bacterium UBA9273]HBL58893.1 hypothetical protein [Cyanobacteria bacterium UBA8803]